METTYFPNGQIKEQIWRLEGKLHNDTLTSNGRQSAYISYYETGQIREESWWVNGERHNSWNGESGDGYILPAYIKYFRDGQIMQQAWWVNGQRHRVDGPASIEYYEENRQIHFQAWWMNGQRHNSSNERTPNGSRLPSYIEYYRDGQIKHQAWWMDGERHRVGGPAYVEYNENGNSIVEKWWMYGRIIPPELGAVRGELASSAPDSERREAAIPFFPRMTL